MYRAGSAKQPTRPKPNLPTGVGMYRMKWGTSNRCEKSPHRRGDVPSLYSLTPPRHIISPQAWGCTAPCGLNLYGGGNLPTGVGMYRYTGVHKKSPAKSPHRRGDVPYIRMMRKSRNIISPQAWGCTAAQPKPTATKPNLPTGVGMYRGEYAHAMTVLKSPHRRGDVPAGAHGRISGVSISPQAWGCTVTNRNQPKPGPNLPTGVGMYRTENSELAFGYESPHRRGDVPYDKSPTLADPEISPQAWGCTGIKCCCYSSGINLPTGVGMYRYNGGTRHFVVESPHRRGDVPGRRAELYPRP